jgi:hypothetical protein
MESDMCHTIEITLYNAEGMRLTTHRATGVRNTATENEIREKAEVEINGDVSHGRFGPWKVIDSKYIS